ncbi:MAG: hypothetical protein IT379_13970 [Deltaproteobacteria bacterium]|nr:hypothetical protein [Deltaproteobacteria bacterium]
MADRATRSERFLPYAYERHAMALRIADCRLDDVSHLERIDPERHLLDLEGRWSAVELALVLDLPRATLERVAPVDEHESGPFGLLIVVHCVETRLRSGHWLVRTACASGAHEGRVCLRRQDLAGTAALSAFLVRERAATSRSAGLAAHRGARLAGTRPWELRIDRRRAAVGGHLDVRFRRFSEDASLSPIEKAALYLLESETESPVLWINADHVQVAAALGNQSTSGGVARVREVAFDLVAAGVWSQLFLRSVLDLLEHGEPTYEWQGSVLDALLPDLYPSISDRRARLAQLRYDADDLAAVMARVDVVVQRRNAVVRHLEALTDVRA